MHGDPRPTKAGSGSLGFIDDGLLRDPKRRATTFAIRHDAAAYQTHASEVRCKDTPGLTLSSPGNVE